MTQLNKCWWLTGVSLFFASHSYAQTVCERRPPTFLPYPSYYLSSGESADATVDFIVPSDLQLRLGYYFSVTATTTNFSRGTSAGFGLPALTPTPTAAPTVEPTSMPIPLPTSTPIPTATPSPTPTPTPAPVIDKIPPGSPFIKGAIAAGTVSLTWDTPPDNFGVAWNEIWKNGALYKKIASQAPEKFIDAKVNRQTKYFVVAVDAAGNRSAASNTVTLK